MFLLRACLRGGVPGGGRILSARAAPALSSPRTRRPPPVLDGRVRHRPFSSSGGGGGDDDDGKKRDDEDKNFFLGDDEESLPHPPSYVRDAVTGKWTEQTHATLSSKDKKLLNLDGDAKEEAVMERLEERWRRAASEVEEATWEEKGGIPGMPRVTLNKEHERVASRIGEQRLALGPIGREPADAVIKGGDGEEANANPEGKGPTEPEMERPLTPREFQALRAYAKKEHGVSQTEFDKVAEDDPDLIPHNSVSSGGEGAADSKQFFDADLDLAYLNPRMNQKAFGEEGVPDDPFADLLPGDLNPARKVNRRLAKPIPKRLLHHNNLSLLRRYTTPGGKIMNRVQSRLGAKDQRKIAKLVKRARQLGLIPYMGQWKFEDHGYIHERGFAEANDAPVGEEAEGKRDWEVELERRGLWPLADDTEVVKRHYGMERMMDHIAGPRGSRKRKELEELLGGAGGLVPDDRKAEEGKGS